eukprot:m.7661 g.7661  ORF g.7661 m.7661 type:complete len:296 (-) comp3751_c0_seq1:2005-2892(-)
MSEPNPMTILKTRNKGMHSAASVENGLNFVPNSDDVFIVTYPKCGTTWTQQICHGLRTRGSMNFKEITCVIPWDILALDCGQKLEDDQVAKPRLFKSHEDYSKIGKGGKYIYVARNPLDAFMSFYKFMPAYVGLKEGDITMDEFADAIFAGASQAGQIWHHFLSWWHKRNDENVLFLFFEDLKDDLEKNIHKIAEFMGIAIDDELLEIVKKQSSHTFMSQHASKFDDHFVFEAVREQMGLPSDAQFTVGKVRKGGGKVGYTLTEHLRKRLQERWTQVITAEFPALKTYEDMRAAL